MNRAVCVGLGFALGALAFLVADIVDVTVASRHIAVTTMTGQVVGCHNITINPAGYGDSAVLCAYAIKDGGFRFRGWRMNEVKEVRAR